MTESHGFTSVTPHYDSSVLAIPENNKRSLIEQCHVGRHYQDFSPPLAGIIQVQGESITSVARGISLGASGHMSVKGADMYGAWLRARFLTRPTLSHLDIHASLRYRPIARDRRGLLLGRCAA
jgi:hypothetical protein